MRIIKNKKLFGFINIFDILFLFLIILLLFANYYRYYLSSEKELFAVDTKIEYTGYISKVGKGLVNNIRKDDLIYVVTARDNVYLEIGEITDIKLIPYSDIDNGDNDYYDVILTISEFGKISNGDYITHTNVPLYTLNKMKAVTKYANFEMQLLEVREAEPVRGGL